MSSFYCLQIMYTDRKLQLTPTKNMWQKERDIANQEAKKAKNRKPSNVLHMPIPRKHCRLLNNQLSTQQENMPN